VSPADGLQPKPKKKRSLLKVPSRSSSNTKNQTASDSTALTGATVVDDSGSFERSSKTSLTGKKREGSRASNRRSRRAQAGQSNAAEPVPAPPEMQDGTKTEKKKGGFLFSLLNCCSPSENAGSLDNGDPTLPPKPATKMPANRGRQAAPVEKQEPNAAESGNAELKDHYDEKVGLRPDLEQRPVPIEQIPGNEQIQMPEKTQDYGHTVPGSSTSSKPVVDSNASDERAAISSPSIPIHSGANETAISLTDRHPDVNVVAATPTIDQEEAQETSDRTPQQVQRDSDVHMPDAPPVEDEADELINEQPRGAEVPPPRTDLPPPPPRDSQTALAAAPPLPGPPEKQQWLLPPIQSQFKGKKCLVLDLDETLVHSSFKVCP
jgi:carboxy-terminal domain RNA polymerase II polypeptide A small phosphatase